MSEISIPPHLEGVAEQLATMRQDFSAETFDAIHAAVIDDLRGIASGLRDGGAMLARHGHVLTSVAGVVGANALSLAGQHIELHADPAFARDVAQHVEELIQYLSDEARP